MDYPELRAAIADWLNRDDLVAVIPTFIALAEADLNLLVKHWRAQARVPLTLDSRYVALPDDWVGTIRIELTGPSPRLLEQATSGALSSLREQFTPGAGLPASYALSGGSLELWPTPDSAYAAEMLYRTKLPALSDLAPTGWLLELMPSCYLYGALLAASPYLKDDARIPIWQTLYDQAIGSVNADGDGATTSGSGLRIRPKTWT